MNRFAKILVTIGCVFLFFIVAIPITAGIKDSGSSPTFINMILIVGLYGAIRAIWKKPKQEENDNDDHSSILQK